MNLTTALAQCPVCQETLRIAELACSGCETRIHGRFALPPLARLPAEMQAFVQVFLGCRGNIREVEKALNLSYPTVRSRLEAVIEALGRAAGGGPGPRAPGERRAREDILAAVERGELSLDDALAQLGGK